MAEKTPRSSTHGSMKGMGWHGASVNVEFVGNRGVSQAPAATDATRFVTDNYDLIGSRQLAVGDMRAKSCDVSWASSELVLPDPPILKSAGRSPSCLQSSRPWDRTKVKSIILFVCHSWHFVWGVHKINMRNCCSSCEILLNCVRVCLSVTSHCRK